MVKGQKLRLKYIPEQEVYFEKKHSKGLIMVYIPPNRSFLLPEAEVEEIPPRSISEIAREIKKEWVNPSSSAIPYINAMLTMNTIDDNYGYDTARDIITYFMRNATHFKGEAARRIKSELKTIKSK